MQNDCVCVVCVCNTRTPTHTNTESSDVCVFVAVEEAFSAFYQIFLSYMQTTLEKD